PPGRHIPEVPQKRSALVLRAGRGRAGVRRQSDAHPARPGWRAHRRGGVRRLAAGRPALVPQADPALSAHPGVRQGRQVRDGGTDRPGDAGVAAGVAAMAPESRVDASDVGAVYGKLRNRSRKSVAFAASPSIAVTPKISSIVRSVELWV